MFGHNSLFLYSIIAKYDSLDEKLFEHFIFMFFGTPSTNAKNNLIDEPEFLTALPTPLPLKDEEENSEWTTLINYGLNNLKAIISLKDILTSNSIKLEDLETNEGITS